MLLAQVNFLNFVPECSATQGATQSIPNNSLTPVTLDTEVFDPYSMHSPTVTPSRIIPTVPGRYMLSALAQFAANSTGARGALLRINGTTTVPGTSVSVLNAGAAFTGYAVPEQPFFFNGTTDYVELLVSQTSGAGLGTTANGSALTVRWDRAA